MSAAHKGDVISAETRQKISIALTGKIKTPEHRESISRGQTGKRLTPEHKASIGKGIKRWFSEPEHREKLSKIMSGKKHSPGSIEKMKKAKKGKEFTLEHRINCIKGIRENSDKISKSLTGKKKSPEHIRKMRESLMERVCFPEYKEKLSLAAKRRFNDPKQREILSRAHTGKKLTSKHRESISLAQIKLMQENPKTKNFKYRSGLFWSDKNKLFMFYRSSYELTAYQILEQLSDVESYERESLCIGYTDKNGGIRHTIPDILITYKSGRKEIIEVKPSHFLERDKEKLYAMQQFARNEGIGFNIWTEKELFSQNAN